MPRFSPGVVLLSCAAIVVATCDAPLSTDLLSPDGSRHEIVDGRSPDVDSNVYLLPPIGESYTAVDFDEYTPTRVEVCPLVEDRVALATYESEDWLALKGKNCVDAGTVVYEDEIELKTDDLANPQHYQLNLKTSAEDYNKAFRVTVFTLDGSPLSGVAWEPKAWFGLALFENSSAINVPEDWVGETAGQNFPVKYVVEKTNSFAVEVDCEGGTFVGLTAGVSVLPNTFDGCDGGNVTLVLVQEPVDLDLKAGEVCLPVGWEQDGPCYRWQLYTFDGSAYTPYQGVIPDTKPLTVAYCLDPGSGMYNDTLWSGFKTPAPYDTYVTPTINTESGFDYLLDCPLEAEAAGFAGLLQRVRRFFGLDPQPLYAAHRGFGELVGGTLSHFGRAKAQTLEKISGDGQSGLINSTLSDSLVVQALTIPHEEAFLQLDAGGNEYYDYETDDPVALQGEYVTFKVMDGGGTLSGASGSDSSVTVQTDEFGYAKVSWTLGPDASPPDQTVKAYGDHFGTLVNDQFVADAIWFTATAYDVVTDFREPLDEKAEDSGAPYMQASPSVLLCEVPADGPPVAQPCADPMPEFTSTDLKLTEEYGRWFYQVNWKPKEYGIDSGHIFVVQVVLDGGVVVGESVGIKVDKGGKVELVDGQLQINPTTDLPIKFTLSRVTP